MATRKPPRRAARDPEGRRDPERTREWILQAAVAEFGQYGYNGARVARIAEASGLNAQLITYHFDGKAGLYQAVIERWLEPQHLLLALIGMASAPVALPHIARRVLGVDPDRPELQAAYAEQVERLVRHLARGAD